MSANKKYTALLVLFMVIIFILSLIPIDAIETKIKHRFNALALLKLNIEDSLKIPINLSLIQNVLHFPFYGLLAFLWMGFFDERKIALRNSALSTAGITFFISLFLEFMQFFLVARDASFADIILNLSGSLSGMYIYWLMKKSIGCRK